MNELDQLKMLTESLTHLEETLAKYSYYDDFKETHPRLPMNWSIYKNDKDPILDFTTVAPDGEWPVMYEFDGSMYRGDSAVVRGGAFDIEPTVNAIKSAVSDTGYWGTYIEEMEWDPEFEVFRVAVGS